MRHVPLLAKPISPALGNVFHHSEDHVRLKSILRKGATTDDQQEPGWCYLINAKAWAKRCLIYDRRKS